MTALEGGDVTRAAGMALARGSAATSLPSSASPVPPSWRAALDFNDDGAARTARTALRVLPHWRTL